MAHKNILMGLSGGQLFSLDHRMIHPRRPVSTPTVGEREEGLIQYNPFIPIIPQNAVTLDTRVAGEAIHVVTAAGTYVRFSQMPLTKIIFFCYLDFTLFLNNHSLSYEFNLTKWNIVNNLYDNSIYLFLEII